DLPTPVVPAQRVRLGVLGAADRGTADRRGQPAPVPAAAVRRGRAAYRGAAGPARSTVDMGRRVPAAGPGAALLRAAPGTGAAPAGPAPGRRMDPRAPGGRRFLGRHPAAVGLLAARPAPARVPAGTPRGARRHRRA